MKITNLKQRAKEIFLPYYTYCIIIVLINYALIGFSASLSVSAFFFSYSAPSVMKILFTISLTLALFISVPISVGVKRFFLNLTHEEAEMKDVVAHFKSGYDRAVGIMFMRILKTFLWSLLFVIPGIYKAYEYAMIPYIIAENPTISTTEAFKASRRLMRGNKLKLFKLQFSFLGWYIIAILPLFAGMFFLSPYTNAATALFYNDIKNRKRA